MATHFLRLTLKIKRSWERLPDKLVLKVGARVVLRKNQANRTPVVVTLLQSLVVTV